MAISLVGTPTTAGSTTGAAASIVLNVPTGVQAGDLMILNLGFGNGGGVTWTSTGWTTPTGFTDQASGTVNCQVIKTRIASGSEPASYTFSSSNAVSYRVAAEMLVYRGCDATTPILAFGESQNAGATTTTIPFPNTAFTGSSAFPVLFSTHRHSAGVANTVSSPSSGFTVEALQQTTSTAWVSAIAQDNTTLYTSTPAAPGSMTLSTATTYCTTTMLLKPASTTTANTSAFFYMF